MILRDAIAADNDALLTLQTQCPMGTGLVVSTVNTPDFFARARSYGSHRVLVACDDDGSIIGSGACALREGRVAGQLKKCGYLFQFFVHPDHRRKGVIRRLYHELTRHLHSHGAHLIYALVMADNTPMGDFSAAKIFPAEECGWLTFLCIASVGFRTRTFVR